MDLTDVKILEILSKNAKATSTEIGGLVNLSVPAVNKRILKLEKEGVIDRYTVLTNAKKVEKPVMAFILIVMRYGEGVDSLLEYIKGDTDVLECYAISGEYDYLIKICSRDVEDLENKLINLKKLKGVIKSHTMLSLMEHKFTPTVLPDKEKNICLN